ncbi:hypothetical protein CA54_44080 [Symmachiella macrocystis]|uniref:Uncharacterized protein n=1 Tax=Symmachiella macrocystis TaxID=2527985 RepID=A0A5C6BB13_9PLAN|nr:hypothetical protein [Symmachiella macrocystis]TWU09168.1 hypothetical protein CA54_44080 [Symmachiella macrocystis]
MQEISLELSIGDAVQIGNRILFVVDIKDDAICLDLNEVNDDQSTGTAGFNDRGKLPPR